VWKNPAWLIALLGAPMAFAAVLAATSGDWARAAISGLLVSAVLVLFRKHRSR
jgi:hypothetical protein